MPKSIYTLSSSTRFNSSFLSSSVKPNLTISSNNSSLVILPDNISGIRSNNDMYFRPLSIVYTFLNYRISCIHTAKHYNYEYYTCHGLLRITVLQFSTRAYTPTSRLTLLTLATYSSKYSLLNNPFLISHLICAMIPS